MAIARDGTMAPHPMMNIWVYADGSAQSIMIMISVVSTLLPAGEVGSVVRGYPRAWLTIFHHPFIHIQGINDVSLFLGIHVGNGQVAFTHRQEVGVLTQTWFCPSGN